MPMYSGILEQFYFFKSKKNLWHSWHTPILAYKCWYKRIIVCQGSWHSLAQSATRRARGFFFFLKTFLPKNLPIQYKIDMKHPKKSKYKSVVIKKKRYYFYKITWLDITGDSGHADYIQHWVYAIRDDNSRILLTKIKRM